MRIQRNLKSFIDVPEGDFVGLVKCPEDLRFRQLVRLERTWLDQETHRRYACVLCADGTIYSLELPSITTHGMSIHPPPSLYYRGGELEEFFFKDGRSMFHLLTDALRVGADIEKLKGDYSLLFHEPFPAILPTPEDLRTLRGLRTQSANGSSSNGHE